MFILPTKQKIMLARILQSAVLGLRKMIGRGAECIVVRRRVTWKLDLREGIDFAIWLFGTFEPPTNKVCLLLLKPSSIAIDVGANIGAHTLPMAHAVGSEGRVIAFEPTDYAFFKLLQNIAQNPSLRSRIWPVQAMLVDRSSNETPSPIYSSWPLAGGDDLHPLHGGRLQPCNGASVITLDDFVRQSDLRRIDLLKIDIDGFECLMLRGAQASIKRFRPMIVLELAPYLLEEHGGSVEELVDILQNARYTIEDINSSQPLPLNGAKLRAIIPIGAGRNVLAKPLPSVVE